MVIPVDNSLFVTVRRPDPYGSGRRTEQVYIWLMNGVSSGTPGALPAAWQIAP